MKAKEFIALYQQFDPEWNIINYNDLDGNLGLIAYDDNGKFMKVWKSPKWHSPQRWEITEG